MTRRPNSGKGFGRTDRERVCTISINTIAVILDVLHKYWDIYVEKKGFTHWSEWVYLRWGSFSNHYVLTRRVHIWILHEVSESERKLNIHQLTGG